MFENTIDEYNCNMGDSDQANQLRGNYCQEHWLLNHKLWWSILICSEISVKEEIISVTRQYKYNNANKNIKTPTATETKDEVPFIQEGVDISTNRRVLWRTREVVRDSMVKALGI